MPACSLRGLWGSEEEAFPFSERLVKVHGDRSCSSRGPVSRAPAPARPPTPAVVQVFLGDPQSCSGQGCGLGEHSRSFWGQSFSAWSLQLCWCWSHGIMYQKPRRPCAPGPTRRPWASLSFLPSLARPHSHLPPPHPAVVFISPGPGCAHLHQALGTMAALGDGQEPPRVPSPVTLESLRTPGAHRHEARLFLHSHQHGTCLPPPPAPPRPAGGTRGSPRGPGALAPSSWGRGAGLTG